MTQRDLISRLADRGEEMLAKFSETPGATRVLELMNATRERIDDLQKRVIGLEGLERRLDEVEQRLGELEGGGTAVKQASAAATPPAAKKPAAEQPTAVTAKADDLTAAAAKAKADDLAATKAPAEQPGTDAGPDS